MVRVWFVLWLCLCYVLIACHSKIGLASWYSTKESKGLMANGKPLDDRRLTAASWDYPLGSFVKVCRYYPETGRTTRCVVVEITDRGPAKRFYNAPDINKRRIIDLTRRAFIELAPLRAGLVFVKVRPVKINSHMYDSRNTGKQDNTNDEHKDGDGKVFNFGLFKVKVRMRK